MKSKLKRINLILICALASNCVFAAGLTDLGKIDTLSIGAGVNVKLVDGTSAVIVNNPDNCNLVDAYHVPRIRSNGDEHVQYEEVVAALMMAKSTDVAIKFYLDGCFTNNAGKERPVISSVNFF